MLTVVFITMHVLLVLRQPFINYIYLPILIISQCQSLNARHIQLGCSMIAAVSTTNAIHSMMKHDDELPFMHVMTDPTCRKQTNITVRQAITSTS
jgi:hypothetical protein